MSRLEWLLSGFLALLIVVVATLAFVFWFQEQRETEVTQQRAAEESAAAPTALGAYEIARPAAEQWAPDARLVNARASWPAGVYAGEVQNWGFLFYSPDRAATALISVNGGTATLIDSSPVRRPLQPAELQMWQADSATVIEQLLANGGRDFIQSHEDVEMTLTLDANQNLLWKATLVATGNNEVFRLVLGPSSAEVVAAP